MSTVWRSTPRTLDLLGNTVDHVTFGGTASDRPPFADAGADQQVTRGATVTLDASGSIDPEGASLGYEWQQLAGPPVSLQGASTVTPSFTAASSGRVVLSLVVADGNHSSTRDIVQVEVIAGADLDASAGIADQKSHQKTPPAAACGCRSRAGSLTWPAVLLLCTLRRRKRR